MQDGDMEEKGNRCFDMLRKHSFFYPIGNENEKEDLYEIYPNVYALAQSLAGNESCYYPKIGTSSCKGADTLHATIILRDDDTGNVPGPLSQAVKLRMLKLVKLPEFKVPSYVFRKFPYLRALDLSCTRLTELPSEVSKLKLLKILILSGSRFTKLPDTVCDLKNLQTLILNGCEELIELPEKIGQLTNLRHLEVKDTPDLKKFPKGLGKLTNLRTLSKFVVAAHSSRKGAKIGELKELNLLQGHLEIKGLHRVKRGSDAFKAALADKTDLQSLRLDFEHNLSQKPESVKIMEDVLETLKPNQAVEIVQLCNYPETARLPSWWVPINQE
ncbi:hypothetical protein MKW94_010542 [Papaver nudicaule]|uniref:Disease resistance R13L4/SHOC-2-like LRR domain-containing protein n=1 Tax=Papaver nudicaule TaxID=74823 RepID=A0AA42ASI2_PAPNU|nr:hypothetical protein [Papaver nudicaule]